MFSFRTTALEEQLDKALLEGKVGCFCTQNCWNTDICMMCSGKEAI